MTGPKGDTGPTGATGNSISSKAHIYNIAGFTTSSARQPIPLSSNGVILGSSITHVANSPNILLAPNRTYLITYMSTFKPPSATTGVNYLTLNSDPIPGSGFNNAASQTGTQDLDCTTLIITTPNLPQNILNLVAYNSGTSYDGAFDPGFLANISITIIDIT
ncbi:hypothetical protein ACT7C6_01665 [Bacillus paranthracis]